jgi:hypothetical protein
MTRENEFLHPTKGIYCPTVLCRRINMAGLGPKTVPHLADAIHAAVTIGV